MRAGSRMDRRRWGDVNVECVELVFIYDGSNGEVFCSDIVWEKMVRGKVEEFD